VAKVPLARDRLSGFVLQFFPDLYCCPLCYLFTILGTCAENKYSLQRWISAFCGLKSGKLLLGSCGSNEEWIVVYLPSDDHFTDLRKTTILLNRVNQYFIPFMRNLASWDRSNSSKKTKRDYQMAAFRFDILEVDVRKPGFGRTAMQFTRLNIAVGIVAQELLQSSIVISLRWASRRLPPTRYPESGSDSQDFCNLWAYMTFVGNHHSQLIFREKEALQKDRVNIYS
jgi:hypothetical protein